MRHVILLVEDSPDIMKINRDTLLEAGYGVLEAKTAADARLLLQRCTPDLIVLDILLPDGDGLALCKKLRGESGVPILFLTALGGKADILAGLRAGGDDYLSKPYDLDILLARIETLLRRTGPEREPGTLHFGALSLDLSSRRALLGEKDLLLAPKEFTLLEALVRRPGQYVGADTLYGLMWGMETLQDIRTVKEHIYRLRRKLADAPVYIDSARGRGYRFRAGPEDESGEMLTEGK